MAGTVVEHVVEDSHNWEDLGLEEAELVHGDLIGVVDGHGSHHSSFGGVPDSDWGDVSGHGPGWDFANFDVSEKSAISWDLVDSSVGNTVPNMGERWSKNYCIS